MAQIPSSTVTADRFGDILTGTHERFGKDPKHATRKLEFYFKQNEYTKLIEANVGSNRKLAAALIALKADCVKHGESFPEAKAIAVKIDSFIKDVKDVSPWEKKDHMKRDPTHPSMLSRSVENINPKSGKIKKGERKVK